MLIILDETNPHSEMLLLNVEENSLEKKLVDFDTSKPFEELSPKEMKALEEIGEFMKIIDYPDDMDYDEASKYIKDEVAESIKQGQDIRKIPSTVIRINYNKKDSRYVDFSYDSNVGDNKDRIHQDRIEQFRKNISGLFSPEVLKRYDVMLNAVNKMIPGFQRIRRITGYLVGTVDRWNNGKAAELKDRVKHGIAEDMTSDYGRNIEEETYKPSEAVIEEFDIDNGILYKYEGAAERVVIPQGVTEISIGAFEDNKAIKQISVPEGVMKIDGDAFKGCSYLKSVNLPSTLIEIGDRAFEKCGCLEYINIPERVSEIGIGAFRGCQCLERISVSKSVSEIKPETFKNCHSLQDVTLYKGLKGIGSKAFAACISLESVRIPSTVTKISADAFDKSCKTISEKPLEKD